jgi:hypothetical protein
VLWAHRFEGAISNYDQDYRLADLDADGHMEVLALPGAPLGSPGLSQVYCFDFRGRVLWTYKYAKLQTFGAEVYAPPFPPAQFFVSEAADTKMFVWVVSDHIPWFPSVVHKLDSTGTVRGEYWSNGYITSLKTAQWDGRRVVLVGARNNEHESASLALLDEDRPSGTAPASDSRYRCRTCPEGHPLAFVVFSKPERLRQLPDTAPVTIAQTDLNGSVVVWVDFGQDSDTTASVFFTLDRQLRPVRVDTADTFDAGCSQLVRKGIIPAFRPGEGLEQLRSVLWWNGRAFVELTARR